MKKQVALKATQKSVQKAPLKATPKVTKKKARKSRSYRLVWRAKWLADGAKTVVDMAQMLRAEAMRLTMMAEDGVVLEGEVSADYAMLVTDDPKVAEKHGIPLDKMFE